MSNRTAHTNWNGTLENGSGRVQLTSSHVGTFDVSWPKRTAEDADGTTSPEELAWSMPRRRRRQHGAMWRHSAFARRGRPAAGPHAAQYV